MALPSNFQSVKYKEEIKEFFQSKLLNFFCTVSLLLITADIDIIAVQPELKKTLTQ